MRTAKTGAFDHHRVTDAIRCIKKTDMLFVDTIRYRYVAIGDTIRDTSILDPALIVEPWLPGLIDILDSTEVYPKHAYILSPLSDECIFV
jgi:hypothetical protein